MPKETETKETVSFVVIIFLMVAFQLGWGCDQPGSLATSMLLNFVTIKYRLLLLLGSSASESSIVR